MAPDGSAFTFVAPAADGYYQLFRRALAGGPVEQLTIDPSHKTQPAWSPDGARLAFTAWSYDASIWRVTPLRPRRIATAARARGADATSTRRT